MQKVPNATHFDSTFSFNGSAMELDYIRKTLNVPPLVFYTDVFLWALGDLEDIELIEGLTEGGSEKKNVLLLQVWMKKYGQKLTDIFRRMYILSFGMYYVVDAIQCDEDSNGNVLLSLKMHMPLH